MAVLKLSFDIDFQTTKERKGRATFTEQSPVSRWH